jgi:uncharacterized membrane protein YfcA
MSVENTQTEVRFPLAGWALWTAVPAAGIGVLAGAIALVRHEAGVVEAGALAFAVVLVGTIVGAMLLAQASARVPAAWSGVLLYAQGVRMFVSVSVGLGAFFLAHPEPFAFWLFFLAASMAVLAGEVAFVLKWIRTAEAYAGREER